MTKSVEMLAGMARKQERHLVGKWRILGKGLVGVGFMTFFMLVVVWTQHFVPTMFDSYVAFDAVLNEYDAYTRDWTYLDFEHREQEEGTDLFMTYLWHVTNPEQFVVDGFKPRLEQRGPYAYLREKYRYEIDWQSDSRNVTFKEWWYLSEVSSPDVCRLMWFRQGLSEYNPNSRDSGPPCADDSELVTILNPKFMSLAAKWGQHGLFGELSRPPFERIKEAFTAPDRFPRAVKADLMSESVRETWTFREAVHVATVLFDVKDCLGAAASAAFAGAGAVSCGGTSFGTASAIGAAGRRNGLGTIAISDASATLLLDDTAGYSPLNFDRGVSLWIAAGRSHGYVAESTVLSGTSTANSAARRVLVSELQAALGLVTTDDAEAVVEGVASYLYETWMLTTAVSVAVTAEWAGYEEAQRGGGCDVGLNQTTLLSSAKLHELQTRITDDLYRFECPFGIFTSLNFSGSVAEPLNLTFAAMVADYAQRDTRNEVGMHADENLVRWYDAFEYCNATVSGLPTTCEGMAGAVEAAMTTLPLLWSAVEVVDFTNQTQSARLTRQMCAIAGYFYETLSLHSSWQELYTATHVSEATGITFQAGALEDMGYAQWAGGYVTYGLWTVPSVLNLKRQGHWKFYDANYQINFIELHSQAMAVGYSMMNLSLADGRLLLNVLAAKGAAARNFRGNIGHVSSSYRCDGLDCDSEEECNLDFFYREDMPVGTAEEDFPLGTCEAFGEFCDCTIDGAYYVTQNAYANFSRALPWNEFPHDSAHSISRRSAVHDSSSDDIITAADFRRAAFLLDKTFQSSAEGCTKIQGYYRDCAFLVEEPEYKDWLTRCSEWETLISDPTYGVYCDETTILRIDSPTIHDYQSAELHPYPRKRGNVVATWLQEWMYDRVFVDDRVVCDDPLNCDWAAGGLFTTQPARTLLFEGYVDRLAMAMLNADLRPYNLTARCLNRSAVALSDDCQPFENTECTAEGYEIVGSSSRAVFDDHSSRREDWFLPELLLNLTDLSRVVPRRYLNTTSSEVLILDNPVFALYPGKLWNPHDDEAVKTFHKDLDCENRLLGGVPDQWAKCESTLLTGKSDLQEISHVANWHGNSSLETGHGFVAPIRTSSGAYLSSQGQAQPYGWEGWKKYNFSFRFRSGGLDFRANETIFVLEPQYLLLMELERQRPGNLDIGMVDANSEFYYEWPTRREFSDENQNSENYTRQVWVRLNRYESKQDSFTWARTRAVANLRDTQGERYTVPVGLASLEKLSGTPLFVSLPLFYDSTDGTNEVQFQVYFDNIAENRRYHSYLVDVEPITGLVVREARRFQFNFRFERSMLFPYVVSSQQRCLVPTADFSPDGYGCFLYFPVWWQSEERVLDGEHARRLKNDYLDVPLRVFMASFIGGSTGLFLILAGFVPWFLTHRREKVFRSRIYVD